MKHKVKLPSGKFIQVKHISEFLWGELEDLEALQEKLTDESNPKVFSTIKKFLGLLVPKLTDKDRRAMGKEQMNKLIEDVWKASSAPLDAKESDAQEAEDSGKA